MKKHIFTMAMIVTITMSLFAFSYSSKNFIYKKLDLDSQEQRSKLVEFCEEQSCRNPEEETVWLIYVKQGLLMGTLAGTLWESSDGSKNILLSKKLMFSDQEELEMKLTALGVETTGLNEIDLGKEQTCPAEEPASIAMIGWILGGAITVLPVIWQAKKFAQAFKTMPVSMSLTESTQSTQTSPLKSP